MAALEITSVTVGPQTMTYTIQFAPGVALTTQDDMEAAHRLIQLLPHMSEHVCINEYGDTFAAALPHTDFAHILEHMVIELIAQCGRNAGEIVTGQTRSTGAGEGRTFETVITCFDDTLTMAALRAAVWVMEWSFAGGKEPLPNIDATVAGLNALIDKIDRVPTQR